MTKSEKLIGKILCDQRESMPKTIDERLLIVEGLLKYMIDNELSHIWLFIKIILGSVLAIFGTMLVTILKG